MCNNSTKQLHTQNVLLLCVVVRRHCLNRNFHLRIKLQWHTLRKGKLRAQKEPCSKENFLQKNQVCELETETGLNVWKIEVEKTQHSSMEGNWKLVLTLIFSPFFPHFLLCDWIRLCNTFCLQMRDPNRWCCLWGTPFCYFAAFEKGEIVLEQTMVQAWEDLWFSLPPPPGICHPPLKCHPLLAAVCGNGWRQRSNLAFGAKSLVFVFE